MELTSKIERWLAAAGGAQRRPQPVLRWVARISGAACVVVLLGFLIGEGVHPSRPSEWFGLLFFPFGVICGLVLAWWKEGLGGLITVDSLAAFYLVHRITSGVWPSGWAWFVFAAPGFLFVLCAVLDRPAGGSVRAEGGERRAGGGGRDIC